MSEFIDLEPIPEAENTVSGSNGKAQKKNVESRQADIAILKDALPDVRYNELTKKYEYGPRSNPTVLEGDDIDLLSIKLCMEHNVLVHETRIRAAFKYLAKTNPYCPIKRYLTDCAYRGEYFEQWDELGKVLLGSDDPFATTVLQRFLIGAVARAYKPGIQMQWMPIIIGEQGCGKSQLIHKLVPDDLFAEISINIDILMKEMYRLHVAWVIELPEVDNYFNPRNIEDFKNLVSTERDEVRFPYSPMTSRLRRRFVLAGTSNRSEFLVDPTGNRRFIPVEIPMGFETPWRQLPDFRHQLWATAIREFEAGQPFMFTSEENRTFREYVQQFGISDPWEEQIIKYISDKDEVTTAQILTNALQFRAESATVKDSKRCAAILQQLGWRKSVTSRKDASGQKKSVRLWKPPIDTPKPNKLVDF